MIHVLMACAPVVIFLIGLAAVLRWFLSALVREFSPLIAWCSNQALPDAVDGDGIVVVEVARYASSGVNFHARGGH